MAQVIWTGKAIDQVDVIAEYIVNDSPSQARRVAAKILDATRRLALFPKGGGIVQEFGDPSLREILVYTLSSHLLVASRYGCCLYCRRRSR